MEKNKQVEDIEEEFEANNAVKLQRELIQSKIKANAKEYSFNCRQFHSKLKQFSITEYQDLIEKAYIRGGQMTMVLLDKYIPNNKLKEKE